MVRPRILEAAQTRVNAGYSMAFINGFGWLGWLPSGSRVVLAGRANVVITDAYEGCPDQYL
jgi:hypothetical protein